MIAIAVVSLQGCVSDAQYRYSTYAPSKPCGNPEDFKEEFYYGNSDIENEFTEKQICQYQKHKIPGLPSYYLNFLEFMEDGSLFDDSQISDIKRNLDSQKDNYLIVFIHGWRHNASVGDNDVRRFQTLLAYSSAFLNQRQKIGRYRETKVSGVFVSWRGSSFAECGGICFPAVMTTFAGRKAVSDSLGNSVVAKIQEIERQYFAPPLDRERSFASRMMVVGHSFGGNILAQGLLPQVSGSMENHVPGQLFAPPLGDLTVMLNPASEASKWTAVQQSVRKLAGMDRAHRFSERLSALFPITQRPVVMSITSVCDWPTDALVASDLKNRKIACDRATADAFPVGRILTGHWSTEERTTIGHLDPTPQQNHLGAPRLVGTTHELEVQSTADLPTNYQNAAVGGPTNDCVIVDGWLPAAIKYRASSDGSPGEAWDSNYNGNQLIPVNSGKRHLYTQIRQGGNRNKNMTAITGRSDPFWNVRALDSAIARHGGYMSYQMWCTLNQLVLDQPTAAAYTVVP